MKSCDRLKKILSISVIVIISAFQSANLVAADTVIIDNSQAGTSSTGTWSVSGGPNPHGANSLWSRQNGDTYTYRFNLTSAGEYRVFAQWTEWSSRRTSVPYDIKHVGGTATINVNQQNNGGRWNQLGNTWNFGSTATITIRSLGNGSTNADAIKLVPVGGNSTPVVKTIGNQSVNAGETLRFNVSATDSDGPNPVLSAETLPANAVFIDNNDGTGVLTWPTIPSDAGNYNVSFIATDTSDPTVSGRETVSIAVVDGSGPAILDNSQAGTSSTGTWSVSGGPNPYGSNSLWSRQNGDTYTYRFNLAAAGEYRVFARWTEWSSRRTSVPYDIKHSGGTATINVNQRNNGGQWNQLGNTWNFGTTATITIRSLGNGSTSADAIKLVPVSESAPNPAGIVFSHSFDNENIGTYTDQDLRDKWQSQYGGNLSTGVAKVVKDPAGRPGNAMSVLFRAGEYGSKHGVSWKSDIGSHEELYLAYDVMFENGYDFALGGKLPGLSGGDVAVANGGGGPPKGNDGWSGRLMFYSQASGLPLDGSIVNYMYVPSNTTRYGVNYRWNLGGQRAFTPGKWHTLEIRYKMNTPGKANGILQGWLDGQLVMNQTVLYRTVQSLKIDALTFNTFHGGADPGWAPSHNQRIFFDNVILSTQPITH